MCSAFDEGPFPCLNKVASHYKELVIPVQNFPAAQRKQQATKSVDWNKRDQQYVQKIKKLHQQLLAEEKPVRITISRMGKRLGILANLEHHLDKMPLTKQLLMQIVETVQAFQIRRACKTLDKLIEHNEPIKLWKVQRQAAIQSYHSRNQSNLRSVYSA